MARFIKALSHGPHGSATSFLVPTVSWKDGLRGDRAPDSVGLRPPKLGHSIRIVPLECCQFRQRLNATNQNTTNASAVKPTLLALLTWTSDIAEQV